MIYEKYMAIPRMECRIHFTDILPCLTDAAADPTLMIDDIKGVRWF